MPTSVTISPPNSLILISGDGGSVPDHYGGGPVVATSTLIAIGTLNEIDGPTHITLGKRRDGFEGLEQIYSGRLAGLTGQIGVQTCLGDLLLSEKVQQSTVDVWVFANHQSEPDEIVVLFE